jgi:6-phosphogluconate dehydrogenase
MGLNMALRISKAGHKIVAYDPDEEARKSVERDGVLAVSSLQELMQTLKPPRFIWVMVPSGSITEQTIETLSTGLDIGDVVIDGGNSNYKDSVRRGSYLLEAGIGFLDVGTSGGVWGLENGYSIMVGGDRRIFEQLEPIFKALAPGEDIGYGLVGPSGSGHFVKMIHNGIEYGLSWRQSLEFWLQLLKYTPIATHHYAVPVFQSPNTSTGSHIQKTDPSFEQI